MRSVCLAPCCRLRSPTHCRLAAAPRHPRGYVALRNRTVAFPFGHGLSYTTFKYQYLGINSEQLNLAEDEAQCGEMLCVYVKVTNTGIEAGRCLVMPIPCTLSLCTD